MRLRNLKNKEELINNSIYLENSENYKFANEKENNS